MAQCPKCKSRLSLYKIVSLSRHSNRVLCSSCNTVLEVNRLTLGLFGGSAVAIFMIIAKGGSKWFGIENSLISIGIAILSLIIITILFYYQIRLRESSNQKKSEFVDNFDLKKRPPLPDHFTRIEYLKNRFYDKSLSELEYISQDSSRVSEAREAAKQLIVERKNVT